jgi:hypothetical protein
LAVPLLIFAACSPLPPVCDQLDRTGGCAPERVLANYNADGFELNLSHTRYQWVTEMEEVIAICRESIHKVAEQLAAAKGREIQPIDDSKISMSIKRDHSHGHSMCKASYDVAYKL